MSDASRERGAGAPLGLTRRQITGALVAAAGAAAATAALGLGRSAAAPMWPQGSMALPAGVEGYSPYLPQVICDPVEKPGVRAFRSLVLSTYGRGRDGGIVRSCRIGGNSEHKEGRAWDWFVDLGKQGDQDAAIRTLNWLLMYEAENARRVGIMYIIWLRHIWSSYRHEDGWRRYSGPNPHTDHVHFSFSWAGANKRTSWWTGEVAGVDRGPRRLSALSVDRLDALPLDLLDTEAC